MCVSFLIAESSDNRKLKSWGWAVMRSAGTEVWAGFCPCFTGWLPMKSFCLAIPPSEKGILVVRYLLVLLGAVASWCSLWVSVMYSQQDNIFCRLCLGNRLELQVLRRIKSHRMCQSWVALPCLALLCLPFPPLLFPRRLTLKVGIWFSISSKWKRVLSSALFC